VREDPLALEIVREMGHHSDYLSSQHTRKWFRQELSFPSAVIDRGSLDAWQAAGRKSSYQRASERVEVLLRQPLPPSISRELSAELRRIATRIAQEFGMQALPALPE